MYAFTHKIRRAFTCVCLAALVATGSGCLSSKKTAKVEEETDDVALLELPGQKSAEIMIGKRPAPTPAQRRKLAQKQAEDAHYRALYKNNRTVPPQEYAVRPKPSRNNNYGEFEENLYASLDAQPRLPGMPGDLMPMMGGGLGGDYPPPQNLQLQRGDFHSYPPADNRADSRTGNRAAATREDVNNLQAKPKGSMSSATAKSLGIANAGLMTEERFYPVEQLVFGGEFPDLDKPENYRLMPNDVVTITVKDHPEFCGKLTIQPDGTIRIPNLPDLIRLRGMTVDEAAEELRRELQIYIKGECIVRVQTNRAKGGYYFVLGDVLQPGRFPMGLETIKLSDAVLAANWELNPNRDKDDDEELGPAFPTANARGKFVAPRTADLANVMLVTPHRSQPVRTTHDVRQAMLGIMREDPIVRPGQIIVVPSLDPRRNRELGLDMPEAEQVVMGGQAGGQNGRGFSGANSSARLPDVGAGGEGYGYAAAGTAHPGAHDYPGYADQYQEELSPEMMDCLTPVQRNMARSFQVQKNTEVQEMFEDPFYQDEILDCDNYYAPLSANIQTNTQTNAQANIQANSTPMSTAREPSPSPAGVPAMSLAEWTGKAPSPDDHNAMAPAQTQDSRAKTSVQGVEVRTRSGRRLAVSNRPRRDAETEEMETTETMTELKSARKGKWNLGF